HLGSDSTFPYSYTIQSLPAGYVTIAAVARDNTLTAAGAAFVNLAITPHYTVELLAVPASIQTFGLNIQGISETGRVVATVTNTNSRRQAVYWDSGTAPNILSSIAEDPDAEVEGISPTGTIYGASINGGTSRAVSWNPGVTNISSLIAGQTMTRA